MVDPRIKRLAKFVVEYSLDVKKNENVMIDADVNAKDFVLELYKEILLKGAHPILDLDFHETEYLFFKYAKKHQIEKFPKYFHYTVKKAKKYIFVDTEEDVNSLEGVDYDKIISREKIMEPINTILYNRRDRIKSCIVGFPCKGYAQEADMSIEEYGDFVFNSCLQDWGKISRQAKKILNVFKKGKKVHLIGKGVDLEFEINGEKAEADLGKENMPGGEVYMAPKKRTLNGWIKFDYPGMSSGRVIEGIFLKFENGKIIELSTDTHEEFFRRLLKTDRNSGYVGEFGIGINKKINRFTKNLLFDEKIGGTIHLALGMAYLENGGGNNSAIHLDLIKDMKKGKIILDGRVVQENGIWKI